MKQNTFKIGTFIIAIAPISSPINAQSIVENRLWLAQSERTNSLSTPKTDSQGCVYEKGNCSTSPQSTTREKRVE
jgi:hypothetical protein